MKHISELMVILSGVLCWNKARLSCLSNLLLALVKVRTVNLREIAVAFTSSAKVDSRYKRLNRFFAHFKIDILIITRCLFKLFFSEDKPVYLIIDRTNWFRGKAKINVFLLSAAHEEIAIPLYWALLDKAGSSNAQEQIQLVKHFLERFERITIAGLLADREFGNGEFFQWLNKQKVPFYIRIKEDSVVRVKGKDLFAAERLFRHLNPKTSSIFELDCEIFGEPVYIAGSRSEKGELMIIATNVKDKVKQAVAIYIRRWEIENLFQSLKGRGFRFEDTHMIKPERLEKLISVLAIAFCLAHKAGEWRSEKHPIVLKNYKESKRPQYSFFRYGLDLLRDLLLQPNQRIMQFKRVLSYFFSISAEKEAAL